MCEYHELGAAIPLRNVDQVVGSNDKEEVDLGSVRVSQVMQRVERIRTFRALNVDHADRESMLASNRSSHHSAAVTGTGDARTTSMRGFADGDE